MQTVLKFYIGFIFINKIFSIGACIKRASEDKCEICSESLEQSGICVDIKKNPINNCLIYKEQNKCKRCNFGYQLSESKKACNKIEDL